MENFYGMQRALEAAEKYYEKQRRGEGQDVHERVLEILRAPYSDLTNYEEFLAGLKETITAEEAEIWLAYPEFFYTAQPITVEQAAERIRPELRGRLAEWTAHLAGKEFLLESDLPDGKKGYLRTYLFALVLHYTFHPDGSRLGWACLHWWKHVVDDGESGQFRAPIPELRILPHEGALTGEKRHGRIPVNLEIPDQREILPMDQAEEILRKCHSIAVEPCQCRVTKDLLKERVCDYPVEGVCFMFDRLAEDEVAAGAARAVTLEEALELLRQYRDLGLVQIISNAEHPLNMCNCCRCCCVALRSLQRFEDTVSRVSRYIAEICRGNDCVGCGVCVKICPMDALALKEKTVQLTAGKCIGCGLCVSRCTKSVLKLNKRPGAPAQYERSEMPRIYL